MYLWTPASHFLTAARGSVLPGVRLPGRPAFTTRILPRILLTNAVFEYLRQGASRQRASRLRGPNCMDMFRDTVASIRINTRASQRNVCYIPGTSHKKCMFVLTS